MTTRNVSLYDCIRQEKNISYDKGVLWKQDAFLQYAGDADWGRFQSCMGGNSVQGQMVRIGPFNLGRIPFLHILCYNRT